MQNFVIRVGDNKQSIPSNTQEFLPADLSNSTFFTVGCNFKNWSLEYSNSETFIDTEKEFLFLEKNYTHINHHMKKLSFGKLHGLIKNSVYLNIGVSLVHTEYFYTNKDSGYFSQSLEENFSTLFLGFRGFINQSLLIAWNYEHTLDNSKSILINKSVNLSFYIKL